MPKALRLAAFERTCLALMTGGFLTLSCGSAPEHALGSTPASGGPEGVEPTPPGLAARPRCAAPPGVSPRPRTIPEVVALLNALPKPTSVACFLDSLQRPLAGFATSSLFSAQPALSARSPRVFLAIDRLWLSIVIDGESSALIELGYRPPGDELRSVKGELALPLTDVIAPSAPFERVRYQQRGTVCGLCHTGEQAAPEYGPSAYLSAAFRPRSDSRVGMAELAAELETCDAEAEPHRCEMLSALFGGGVVTEEPFPEELHTFF